jgi:hypothetical protein
MPEIASPNSNTTRDGTWSMFALGLYTLRKIFVAANPAQIIAFLGQLLSPKLPVKPLRFLALR